MIGRVSGLNLALMALLMVVMMVPLSDAQIVKYYPSGEVKAANNIPRFTRNGPVDIEFNVSLATITAPENAEYGESVVLLPVAIMAAGIVALFFYNFLIMCRCCFTCLHCAPTEEDINEHPEKVVKSRNRVVGFFYFFMIVAIAANHILYLGNADIDQGADNIVSGGAAINEVFYDLSASLTAASGNATLVQSKFDGTSGDCLNTLGHSDASIKNARNDLKSGLGSLSTATDTLNTLISDLPPQVNSLSENVELYGKTYKRYALFGCYALIMFIMFLYALAVFFQSSKALIVITLLSEGVVTILTILCGVLMIVVTVLADICMDPTEKLGNLVPSLSRTFTYMGTCEGESPYGPSITAASDALGLMVDATGTLRNLCNKWNGQGSYASYDFTGEYSSWTKAMDDSAEIQVSIAKLNTDINCPAMNNVYDIFVQQALCTNLFRGIYRFWLIEFVVSGNLFFLMIMASVICMYFGTAWKLKKTDAHSHDQKDGSVEAVAYDGVDGDLDDDQEPGYKEEYDFSPVSPNGKALSHSKLEDHEVEMI